MSKTKFTPEPWLLKETSSGGILVERGYLLTGIPKYSNQILPIEDGYLISVAPELYRELEKLVNILEALGHYIDTKSASKVLAKARGEK